MTLDEPLPPELTGRHYGWLTRYRRWPVFSPQWARRRARSLGLLTLGIWLLLLAGPLVAETGYRPWGSVAQVLLIVVLPLFGTPWLAAEVRRRQLPEKLEWRLLLLCVLGTVAGLAAFHHWVAEPMKQQIAAWAGQLDEQGRRPRVGLAIGISTIQGEYSDRASVPSPRKMDPPGPINLPTQLVFATMAFIFAGGMALPRWRTERAGLRALAHERELAAAQARRREAELKLSVLAAQVEPHFLFNTLAGVRSAISTDPARASVMIDQLVDYLRAAIPRLRSDGSAQATVGGQFDIVRAYLGLMAARMPRLQVQVQAPPDLLAAHCPPLMLISLAENAVKHGVEPKLGPAQVAVQAERSADGRLLLRVLDDGVGFGGASSGTGDAVGSGLGLSNIRERLQQLYGDRASLTLKARPEGGVAATLTLPLELSA